MAGFKDFSVGEVLTAADVDDYLANGPFIHLTRSSSQSISNNSTTDVSWTVETSDRSSLVSVTLTSITIPASLAGVCLVTAFGQFAANATGIRVMTVLVNSVNTVESRRDAMATGSQGHSMHASMHKLLSAGDTLKVQVFQSSGGSLNLDTSNVPPQLMINRIST